MDVTDVFAGRHSARWALQFVERVLAHPESMTRALEAGGDYWQDWYGFDAVAERVLQNSNITIATAGVRQWLPGPRSEADKPRTLDEAFTRLMT